MSADTYDALTAVFAAMPGSQVIESDDLGDYAVELAARGWAVFPLAGKVPWIAKRDGGNGVLDATTDLEQVTDWWRRFPSANIGVRVPSALVVVDVDPRHDGHLRLAEHEAAHGPLPATLSVWSGRGDGGRHLYFLRPFGRLSATRLGHGLDIKTSSGYVVAPPSIHPDSGQPYRWDLAPVAAPPAWLIDLLRVTPPDPAPRAAVRRPLALGGSSIADDYSATARWADVLGPHGWRCLDPDGDADGARWLHPAATSACSATVRHGCLFVYTPNTPLEVTEAGDPHGYTRFRAFAVLDHHGDLSAAARALREAS